MHDNGPGVLRNNFGVREGKIHVRIREFEKFPSSTKPGEKALEKLIQIICWMVEPDSCHCEIKSRVRNHSG